MNIAAQLGLNIVGGAGAAYLDRTKPEWVLHVGGTKTGFGADGSPDGVAVTPGALAAMGGLVLLAILPGKSAGVGASMWKGVLANLTGGAFIVEGVKLVEQHVVQRVEHYLMPAPTAGPALMPGAPAVTGALPYGYSPYARVSDYELTYGLQNYGRA